MIVTNTTNPRTVFYSISAPRFVNTKVNHTESPIATIGAFLFDEETGALLYDSETGAQLTL